MRIRFEFKTDEMPSRSKCSFEVGLSRRDLLVQLIPSYGPERYALVVRRGGAMADDVVQDAQLIDDQRSLDFRLVTLDQLSAGTIHWDDSDIFNHQVSFLCKPILNCSP